MGHADGLLGVVTTIYNLLIEVREPGTDRELTLEDDGQTGYAYLRTEEMILASVWLKALPRPALRLV